MKNALILFGFLGSLVAGPSAMAAQGTAALQPEFSAEIQYILVAEDASQYPIQPSEAILIARNAYPDAKVLSVKLLPGGQYAVTLKSGGNVQRVMVDATSGDIS